MRVFSLLTASALLFISFSNARAADWIEECTPIGIEKVATQAVAWELTFDRKAIRLCGVDDRWYNPYKYAWFCVTGTDAAGKSVEVSQMTQKPGNRPCF
jgi:hypothetical protein